MDLVFVFFTSQIRVSTESRRTLEVLILKASPDSHDEVLIYFMKNHPEVLIFDKDITFALIPLFFSPACLSVILI